MQWSIPLIELHKGPPLAGKGRYLKLCEHTCQSHFLHAFACFCFLLARPSALVGKNCSLYSSESYERVGETLRIDHHGEDQSFGLIRNVCSVPAVLTKEPGLFCWWGTEGSYISLQSPNQACYTLG